MRKLLIALVVLIALAMMPMAVSAIDSSTVDVTGEITAWTETFTVLGNAGQSSTSIDEWNGIALASNGDEFRDGWNFGEVAAGTAGDGSSAIPEATWLGSIYYKLNTVDRLTVTVDGDSTNMDTSDAGEDLYYPWDIYCSVGGYDSPGDGATVLDAVTLSNFEYTAAWGIRQQLDFNQDYAGSYGVNLVFTAAGSYTGYY